MLERRRKVDLYLALGLMAALLTGCQENASSPSSASASATPAPPIPSPATSSSPFSSPSYEASPAVREPVTLSFKPVTGGQKIERTTEGYDPPDILLEQAVTGGTILVYKKPGDSDYLYAQYLTDAARYELGIVNGMLPRIDGVIRPETVRDAISITPLSLYGYSIVRIIGSIGNAPLHNYYRLGDGEILPFLLVDTGHAQEIDLDGDGVEEIVSSYGLPTQTYVYSFKDGKFAMADVNEALQAVAVTFNAEYQFEVMVKQGSTEPSHYVCRGGSLIEAT